MTGRRSGGSSLTVIPGLIDSHIHANATVPTERIGQTQSLLTVVGGQVVYAAGPYRRFEQAAQPSGGQ